MVHPATNQLRCIAATGSPGRAWPEAHPAPPGVSGTFCRCSVTSATGRSVPAVSSEEAMPRRLSMPFTWIPRVYHMPVQESVTESVTDTDFLENSRLCWRFLAAYVLELAARAWFNSTIKMVMRLPSCSGRMRVTWGAAKNEKRRDNMFRRTLSSWAVLLGTVLLARAMWTTHSPASRQSGSHLSVPDYITIQ
jgi:hypothetical protein